MGAVPIIISLRGDTMISPRGVVKINYFVSVKHTDLWWESTALL